MRLVFACAILAAGLLASAGCGGSSQKDKNQPAANAAPAVSPDEVGPMDMVLGKMDAPVTLIEYASVACPVCAAFDQQILPDVKTKYIDTGKVKLVFRELPTHAPALAYVGEMVARCVAEKKGEAAYFDVVETLFRTQEDWVDGDGPKAALAKIAAENGVDAASFETCIHRQDLVDLINNMVKVAADSHGINGTPSFIANGEKIDGFTNIDDFEKKLDAALGKASGGEGKS
ncbi:MAG TPA: DsbA family protein [Parvularculaceae bacterium]|nr:DsbA family protein [Parvularculaceae bacterium]